MAGFVYVMSNPGLAAGLVKIGKSDRDPEEFRRYELDGTGVPEPFVVEYYAYVDDNSVVEAAVHRSLHSARHNSRREFFRIPVKDAVRAIRAAAGSTLRFEHCPAELVERLAVEEAAKRKQQEANRRANEAAVRAAQERAAKVAEQDALREELLVLAYETVCNWHGVSPQRLKKGISAYSEPLTPNQQLLAIVFFPFSLLWILSKQRREDEETLRCARLAVAVDAEFEPIKAEIAKFVGSLSDVQPLAPAEVKRVKAIAAVRALLERHYAGA